METDGNKRLPRDKGEQNADFKPWQNASSRIIRVSRVSGGKDRHSKVWTTKGLRDRRVRLSVSTAIQFYDLQDRLGYDQPSKAVDWLIKAADAAIADLPELDAAFPIPPTMLQISPSKSACSSASETSREKRNENEQTNLSTHSSFTELLTAGSEYFVGQNGVFGQQARKLPQFVPGYPLHAYNAEQEMQQYSFVQDHVIPVVDHDLNVSISSVFAGFNRGTLQSNSPYHHHVVDGANLPFFFGASIAAAAAEGGSSENQYVGGFNGRLQVCCNEAHRQAKLKGEGKG